MATLIIRPAHRASQLHQKDWGPIFAQAWHRWYLRWARHSQRKVLRDLADDPHLLNDIGVSREEALNEAYRRVWDIADASIHSL